MNRQNAILGQPLQATAWVMPANPISGSSQVFCMNAAAIFADLLGLDVGSKETDNANTRMFAFSDPGSMLL